MGLSGPFKGTSESTFPVTIANGAALSAGVEIGNGNIVGIFVPTFTSASVTFQVSPDGTNYYDLYNKAGTEVAYAAGTQNLYYEAHDALKAVPYLKVRSGSSGTPVNQGAARTITLVVQRAV